MIPPSSFWADDRGLLRATLLCWLGWALFLIACFHDQLWPYRSLDPDDYMRLSQVRDWLAGQGWFDVHQYRMNAPDGADMHWSRLVDVPLGLVIMVMRPLFGSLMAQSIAAVVVPLGQLALLMLLISKSVNILTQNRPFALLGAALVPISPMVLPQIVPSRVDHHGWQLVIAAAALYLLVRDRTARSALWCGALVAVWLNISIEGLPFAALYGAILGLFWITRGDRRVGAYLGALAATTGLLLFATHAWQTLAIVHCDAVAWPHLAAFGAAAIITLGAMAVIRPGSRADRPIATIAILSVAGAIAAAAYLGPAQSCALDPFGGLEPEVRLFWYGLVPEGLPVWRQDLNIIMVLVWTPIIGLAGSWLGWRRAQHGEQRNRWLVVAMLAAAVSLLSLDVMRTGAQAQLYSLPGMIVVIAELLPHVQRIGLMVPRAILTALLLISVTPATASLFGKAMMNSHDENARMQKLLKQGCNLDALNALPPSRLFAAIDISPEILFRTRHSVLTGGYHRNHKQIAEAIRGFAEPPDRARETITKSGMDYFVFCRDAADIRTYQLARPDGLVSRLLRGERFDWLEPVVGTSKDNLRIFRIVDKAGAKS